MKSPPQCEEASRLFWGRWLGSLRQGRRSFSPEDHNSYYNGSEILILKEKYYKQVFSKNGNFEETHLTPRYSLDNRGKPVGDVEKTFHRPRHLHKDSKTPAQAHINTFSKKTGNLHLDSCSRFFLKRRKTDNFVIFWKTLSKFDTKAGILVPPSKRSPWPPLRGLLEPPPDPGLWNIQSF